MTLNCLCVKWGTKYAAAEVNALFAAIRRESADDVRAFCLTDDRAGLDPSVEVLDLDADPLQARLAAAQGKLKRPGGALRKIAAFNPDLIGDLDGRLLCLDIDVLVTGPLDAIAAHAPGFVTMPAPFRARPRIATLGEGSVIGLDPARHGFLYEEMARRTEEMLAFSLGSEQRYTSMTAERHGALAHFPADWIVSFNRHCRPPIPLNLVRMPRRPAAARVVCFASTPKPEAARTGFRNGLKSTRPAPWIGDYL